MKMNYKMLISAIMASSVCLSTSFAKNITLRFVGSPERNSHQSEEKNEKEFVACKFIMTNSDNQRQTKNVLFTSKVKKIESPDDAILNAECQVMGNQNSKGSLQFKHPESNNNPILRVSRCGNEPEFTFIYRLDTREMKIAWIAQALNDDAKACFGAEEKAE